MLIAVYERFFIKRIVLLRCTMKKWWEQDIENDGTVAIIMCKPCLKIRYIYRELEGLYMIVLSSPYVFPQFFVIPIFVGIS